jgi:hypothetical protein
MKGNSHSTGADATVIGRNAMAHVERTRFSFQKDICGSATMMPLLHNCEQSEK